MRSANTGISAYVDPLGRVHDATGLFVPAEHTYQAETTSITTPYVRFGDWVGWAAFLATILIAVAEAARVRRLRRAGHPITPREPIEDA